MAYLSSPSGSRLRGRYRVSGSTALGLGGNFSAGSQHLFQFRWSDSTRLAGIRSVSLCANTTVAFASGGASQFDLFKATAWTVQGSGGTALDVGSQNKMRTSSPASVSVAGDIRIAPNSALTAGTVTFETNAISTFVINTQSTVGQYVLPTFLYYAPGGDDDSPLTLGFQEGFVVKYTTAIATGQFIASVSVEWSEYEPS